MTKLIPYNYLTALSTLVSRRLPGAAKGVYCGEVKCIRSMQYRSRNVLNVSLVLMV